MPLDPEDDCLKLMDGACWCDIPASAMRALSLLKGRVCWKDGEGRLEERAAQTGRRNGCCAPQQSDASNEQIRRFALYSDARQQTGQHVDN